MNGRSVKPALLLLLRDEEQRGGRLGDGLDVLFVVAASVRHQQVVHNTHDTHEEQEGQHTLSKQEAWSAGATAK